MWWYTPSEVGTFDDFYGNDIRWNFSCRYWKNFCIFWNSV